MVFINQKPNPYFGSSLNLLTLRTSFSSALDSRLTDGIPSTSIRGSVGLSQTTSNVCTCLRCSNDILHHRSSRTLYIVCMCMGQTLVRDVDATFWGRIHYLSSGACLNTVEHHGAPTIVHVNTLRVEERAIQAWVGVCDSAWSASKSRLRRTA